MGIEADKIESEDVKRVDTALEAISNNDLGKAISLLRVVISHAPANYKFSYVRDGKLYVKHWDQEQYDYFSQRLKASGKLNRPIVWLGNAYGRAFFYLGFIAIQEGKWSTALKCLDFGLRLEPDQANFHNEKANALIQMGNPKAALREYDIILAQKDNVAPYQRAMALRGRGVQLIDMGRIDEAEASLKQSLKYSPQNKVALHELEYIKSIRSGGKRARQENLVTGSEDWR